MPDAQTYKVTDQGAARYLVTDTGTERYVLTPEDSSELAVMIGHASAVDFGWSYVGELWSSVRWYWDGFWRS